MCLCVHAHVCASAGVYGRLRRDDEVRLLGACVFSVFVG